MFASKWMELENIMLSEGSKGQRLHISPHMWKLEL
jgi:hypothetical protein